MLMIMCFQIFFKKEKTLYLGSSVFGRLTKYISTLALNSNLEWGVCILLRGNFPLCGNSVFNMKKDIFKMIWNFLFKIRYSNQMYSRNIFIPQCLKSETSAHVQLLITILYIPLGNILALLLLVGNLQLRIPLDKWGHKMTSWMWSHDFSWNFLQYVKYQHLNKPLSWLLDVTNLAKGQCKIYRPEYSFQKSHVIQSLTNFIYQKVSLMYVSNPYHVKKLVNNV